MTVRVERVFELPASRDDVWSFIADPAKRASAISVVTDFEVADDGSATWHISLPIPVVNRTVTVETHDVERQPPEYVEFEGRSRIMNVVGEHELTANDGGTHVRNTFIVDGKVPGVERFFERNMDDELDALEAALLADLGVEA